MHTFVRPLVRLMAFTVVAIGVLPDSAHCQSVSFLSQRVFVTGFSPVIGPRGGVGGVDVDTDGVLSRVRTRSDGEIAELRAKSFNGVHALNGEVRRKSPLRKVSLRRLEAEIARHASNRKSLTPDILYLAGLQRIQCVFVFPESNEIVIAGPAEGWMLRGDDMVGESGGATTLRLDDLLDAIQGTAAAADGEQGISCSIDPSQQGMARVQQMLSSGKVQFNNAVIERMEQLLGAQNVTVTGVRPASHFARVMVGADYMMKRIAMGLERSPVRDVPSYMQMLQRAPGTNQMMAPRWWIATDYETAEKSEDGLAWRFSGRGVKVMSEHGYLNSRGELVNAGRPSPLGKQWADKFTGRYDQLAGELNVFGQLRGCVDLAVVAALITQESLREVANCPLTLLRDSSKLVGEDFSIPQFVPSQASAVRGRSGWVVSVSGGVDIDTWNVLESVETNPKLTVIRDQSRAESTEPWWWD